MSGPAVQRWRVAYRREGEAAMLAQRDASAALEEALVRGGLPVSVSAEARPRPRLMYGPPVSTGMEAAEELVDVFLAERMPRHRVREQLERAMPTGYRLLGLHDVWVNAPSLAATVVAADYRVVVESASDDGALTGVIADVLRAERIDRERDRGGTLSTYDLRPFIEDLQLIQTTAGTALEMRLGIDQQRGIGRPEEVLAELRARSGLALEPVGPVRRGRLHLSPA